MTMKSENEGENNENENDETESLFVISKNNQGIYMTIFLSFTNKYTNTASFMTRTTLSTKTKK